MTESCVDIAEMYGFTSKDKYISRMFIKNDGSTSSYHYYPSNLQTEANNCQGRKDTYISMNTFTRPSRRIDYLAKLKHVFVDLDCYKTEYAKNPYYKQGILEILEKDYFNIKMPKPNMIIDSGRGLYLIWNIDEHKNAFPRWNRVQKYLNTLLKEFGSDSNAIDAARVLRLPGSINSKSKSKVKVLESNLEKHSLYEFIEFYMMDDSEIEIVQPRKKNLIQIAASGVSSLLQDRLDDLETLLVKHRDKAHGLKEKIIFLYRMWALQLYKNIEKVNQEIARLLSRLHHGNLNRILKETKSAERYYKENKIFYMSNEKIVEYLEITEEEMKDLKSIISSAAAKVRKKAYDKKRYEQMRLSKGIMSKEEMIAERQSKIKTLLEEGFTISEIAEIVGVSTKTVQRDKKCIQEICENECTKQEVVENETLENTAVVQGGHLFHSIIMDVVLDSVSQSVKYNTSVPIWISPVIHLRI